MLAEGTPAPPFSLQSNDGSDVSLESLSGKWIVLWWFPQASSGTCTIQGRAFRPLTSDFEKAGAAVYGISFNTVAENSDFASCESFEFPLLSDPSMEVGKAYDVTREATEKFSDKPRRVTYLIDPDQLVRRAYFVENAEDHAAEVLRDLKSLQG